ncbi:hypothetical protein E0Z10_g2461 [Xylaria hypoxylon]|uniref:2EXR domain-containing protein n=1 Tax=Xylaria hypoxylon TaxID=37992 RepID=A0A4Z0Z4B5_9PEZI|nr:hypothetical protein E0Z10_g2461 [Xylaria hypoxylon]
MTAQNCSASSGSTHSAVAISDAIASVSPNALRLNSAESQHEQNSTATAATAVTAKSAITFVDLPLEIREIIWRFALPESRVFNALVWVSAGLKMQLLNRSELKIPLAHVCFEARRVVRDSGYGLAFRDEDESEDPGVWFHPRRDRIERTIWGPGDWNTGA